jgi:hypothetical protein
VFKPDPAGSIIFHAATGLDANAIAAVQAAVRYRLFAHLHAARPARGQRRARNGAAG